MNYYIITILLVCAFIYIYLYNRYKCVEKFESHPYTSTTLKFDDTEFGKGDILMKGNNVKLVFETDGDLTLYVNGKSTWKSGTKHLKPAYVSSQADGNLIIYDDDDSIVWSLRDDKTFKEFKRFQFGPKFAKTLNMYEDGLLSISYDMKIKTDYLYESPDQYSESGSRSIIFKDQQFKPGDTILKNKNKKLVFLPNGKLVLYNDGEDVWNSGDENMGATRVVARKDGDLAMYKNDTLLWSSETSGMFTSFKQIIHKKTHEHPIPQIIKPRVMANLYANGSLAIEFSTKDTVELMIKDSDVTKMI